MKEIGAGFWASESLVVGGAMSLSSGRGGARLKADPKEGRDHELKGRGPRRKRHWLGAGAEARPQVGGPRTGARPQMGQSQRRATRRGRGLGRVPGVDRDGVGPQWGGEGAGHRLGAWTRQRRALGRGECRGRGLGWDSSDGGGPQVGGEGRAPGGKEVGGHPGLWAGLGLERGWVTSRGRGLWRGGGRPQVERGPVTSREGAWLVSDVGRAEWTWLGLDPPWAAAASPRGAWKGSASRGSKAGSLRACGARACDLAPVGSPCPQVALPRASLPSPCPGSSAGAPSSLPAEEPMCQSAGAEPGHCLQSDKAVLRRHPASRGFALLRFLWLPSALY